jgi:hypothetical protein
MLDIRDRLGLHDAVAMAQAEQKDRSKWVTQLRKASGL